MTDAEEKALRELEGHVKIYAGCADAWEKARAILKAAALAYAEECGWLGPHKKAGHEETVRAWVGVLDRKNAQLQAERDELAEALEGLWKLPASEALEQARAVLAKYRGAK